MPFQSKKIINFCIFTSLPIVGLFEKGIAVTEEVRIHFRQKHIIGSRGRGAEHANGTIRGH